MDIVFEPKCVIVQEKIILFGLKLEKIYKSRIKTCNNNWPSISFLSKLNHITSNLSFLHFLPIFVPFDLLFCRKGKVCLCIQNITSYSIMKQGSESSDYEIVIIECCQNCETHQAFARHSQWKYFQQFNELKRKIQKFIANTVVIKNPVPDELVKNAQTKNDKNIFVNRDTGQKIIFPRIGSFEIYIYNILISSKLMTNQWPNHYKILQLVAKVIEQKKNGNPLHPYSVYAEQQQQIPKETLSKELESPQRRTHRIVSKKKKVTSQLASKAYKSIDKQESFRDARSTLQPLSSKLIDLQPSPLPKNRRNLGRYLQSKAENRVKLPSLNVSMNIREEARKETIEQKQSRLQEKEKSSNRQQSSVSQLNSHVPRKMSNVTEAQKVSLLDLRQQSFNRGSLQMTQQLQADVLKFLQNRSVQYSQQYQAKEIMNRSIQYQEQQGFYCDFGLQIDNDILPREVSYNYVQTDKVELSNQPKPYMLDELVQADIVIKKPQAEHETQTVVKQFVDENVSTDMVSVVNRGYQFPQEVVKSVNENEIIDTSFQHLFEKRRNIVDNECYSIDRFEQKSTKYKWVGRANLSDNQQQVKRRLFMECLVFSVYNYYGIKTPSRRLSFQSCSNVIGEKMKEAALHIMTSQNPEIQYLFQFEQWDHTAEKFPLSQIITFRSSRQSIRFSNYGGLLALAYFLNDFQLFTANHCQLGLVIVNQAVKEIHKLSALGYVMHPQVKNSNQQVIVSPHSAIKLNRLSQAVELEFFAMLARISDGQTFQELIKYLQEIFIYGSSTYQQFRSTTLSLKLDKAYQTQIAEQFIKMLENRLLRVQQTFRGKLYTYKKYHTLTPNIKYALPFDHKIERKLSYKEKLVSVSDIVKHVRNKDNLVVIEGEDGSGKTTLLAQMGKLLKQNEKLNILQFGQLRKEKNRVREQLFQLTKNIVLIDNVQLYEAEALALIEKYSKGNFEVSFCITTSNPKQSEMLKNRFPHLTIVQTKLLSFDAEAIRTYLMKVVNYQSYTAKKNLVDKLLENPKFIIILSNPFYLSLYAAFLSRIDCENHELREREITKYMILKEHFSHCSTLHSQEMKEMGINYKQVLPNLRRIAFQYFHNNLQVSEVVREVLSLYEQNQLIRSQLAYYPVNLESVITTSYAPLFVHPIFMQYFLIQAYSFFVEKGYRNMRMQRLYNDAFLLDFIKQRYSLQETHSQLVEVVLSSKKFRNTAQASSNAITLLSKMGFVFSNMNFDDCNISEADLSNSVFYQCSFRGADLQRAVFYKAQMISCVFDNAIMGRINLYSKKYEIQFTAMATSLSVDGKKIAFGCGNYLIVINAETGAQIKRIQAHLDVIRLVKYTRDGNSLITVADDKTLRIWDIVTYKSVVFKLPQKGSISYSNETETIASVNKNSLKVWNLKSMANEAELQGHSEAITTVEFSYDGENILTGSRDTTLRLWTLRGQQKVVFKGHDSEVTAGKLSPGKRTMVSSSKGKDLIMWQTQTGNKILSKKFMNQITQICLDNKEKYIVVTFANDNHLVVLDFLSFDIIHVLTGHQAKVLSLSFDPHFRQLLSLGKDRTARLWQFDRIMETEMRTPKASSKVHKGPILALAYDSNKRRFATSHQNGQINFWHADENTLIEQVYSHNGPVKCLQFDRSGKLYSGGSDGSLRIWQIQVKRQPRTIEIHSSEMVQLRLSEKSRLIATSSAANQLVIYDFTGIKIVMSTRQEGRVNAIEFSADERIMAVGGVEKYVALYQIANSNTVARKQELGVHSEAISSLCFFGESLLVVALKNGQVAIWNHLKASLIKKIENLSPIKHILTFQKKYICFTSEDGKARVVNMDEGRQVKVFRYSDPSTAIDLNEDQSLLYVGTTEGNVLKWNLNCVRPAGKKVEFDRKAIDIDCSRIVTVQSGRNLLIRDLLYHREQLVQVKVDSDIEGVTFDEDRIILLLKNGKYWQLGKKQYRFNTNNHYQGDLFFIRDRPYTNFYKSGLKKIKGMNKPALSVLQEVNS